MPIKSTLFGDYEGADILLYSLSNKNGMTVKVMTYGATITSIEVPKSEGGLKQIACGFDRFEEYFSEAYRSNAPYFGCTVGRYASRIKDGRFTIGDTEYNLACNDGSNHLHGGIKAFDKRVWDAEITTKNGNDALKMSLASPHLEEGYPGNLNVIVWFVLTDTDELRISYEAITDRDTPLSLTNHTYFNLSGFQNTIEGHSAMIAADRYLEPDSTNVPVGEEVDVTGSVTDLRKSKLLKGCFQELKTGFEHYYVLNQGGDISHAATFTDIESGTQLEISTDEPGALFYTGYFTSDDLMRSEGEHYGRFKGLCFETGRYPNGPNLTDSPGSITTVTSPYRSTTIYKIITVSTEA